MAIKPAHSNRSFGIVLVGFFALLATYKWWHRSGTYPYLFGLSALAGATTLFKPSLLTPFKRAWLKLGLIMHRVTSPILLGVMFFGVITPFAVAMRFFSDRDVMRRRFEPNASSYWIKRDPPGPDRDSFQNQF
jgi:hypothetical protein